MVRDFHLPHSSVFESPLVSSSLALIRLQDLEMVALGLTRNTVFKKSKIFVLMS